MKTLLGSLLILLSAHSASATWSVIAIDKKTGEVIVASATCVAQAGFPRRQPIGSRDLMDLQAVIVPGVGVAACQAGADNTHKNQMTVFEELKKGTEPAKIIEILHMDPDIERRQFGILDVQGRSAGHNGSGNSTASLFVPGHVGDYYFQVQGNTLFSDQVMYDAALAFTRAKGTLADHVMAAMEAADAKGGDKRCNCETDPKPSAPCDGKTAHVAYIVIAKKDEVTTKSHNQGDYYAYIRVTDEDIKPSENANPVKTLRLRYDAWKQAGSKPYKSVPIVTLNSAAPDPWFATFSIIAFDPATNEHGVAVQSHAFTAGAAVPYAIPGIGAVATQAAANRLYGPKAIELLKQGLSPAEVVKRLTDDDPGRDTRQVAVIDAKGRSAVYTGKHVIDRNVDPKDAVHLGGYAGHITGRNFSVQGNTLASEDVVKNMARAYEDGKGTMAERLMDALDAGQSAGGDTRGMQSAGLLVVRPIPAGSNSTVERTVDIRVDDAVDPFKELRRLLNITLGVPRTMTDRAAELAKGGNFDAAIAEQKQALEIQPNSDALHYALAQRYAQAGKPLLALVPLREAIRLHPNLAREAAQDPLFSGMRELGEFKRLVRTP